MGGEAEARVIKAMLAQHTVEIAKLNSVTERIGQMLSDLRGDIREIKTLLNVGHEERNELLEKIEAGFRKAE